VTGDTGDFDLVSPERNSEAHDEEGVVVATVTWHFGVVFWVRVVDT
jgi:hypothetical protein